MNAAHRDCASAAGSPPAATMRSAQSYRRYLAVTMVLSLVLLSMVCLSIRSFWVRDELYLRFRMGHGVTEVRYHIDLDSEYGGVFAALSRGRVHPVGAKIESLPQAITWIHTAAKRYPRLRPRAETSLFDCDFYLTATRDFAYENWRCVYPAAVHMIFLILFCVPPFRRLQDKRRELRRLKRVSAGLCPNCAYDLRSSQKFCPECGTLKNEDKGTLINLST